MRRHFCEVGFIRLLQRIFNCDKMHDIIITPDKVLNSCIWLIFLRHHIHELQTVENGQIFHGIKLIGIFSTVLFLQTYAKNI